MKKIILLLSILVVVSSCGEYQKVLKSQDIGLKYTMADSLYNQAEAGEGNSKRKYKKALRIMEQIVPEYRGKPQAQKLMYIYADTYYELEDYFLSGYQFERFAESYPDSEKTEEALYKSAKSYYFLSPRYNLDQTETQKAITKIQDFINRYPESEYLEEANELITELRVKLEKKAYEIAKQYHHTENFTAAITAFNNFILDYPGSPFMEKAYYYRFESAYLYAINSYDFVMAERLDTAREYYEDYQHYYPEGEFMPEAEEAIVEIDRREQNL